MELLEALPEKYRAVVHLCYYEGYSTEEIAALLGRKPATVRSQLARGGLCCGTFGKERKTYDGTGLSEAF
ncbi:sigma-70 region 4 domain-containing protein [Flavonifractor plautii]|nr:sigma-70 region 4 domain-containing protein [Flavonifractor plautii]